MSETKRFRDMGESNARDAIDQVAFYGRGDRAYDSAHAAYLANVVDTAKEMGARPTTARGQRLIDEATDAYSEKFSELYANRKKLKSMRRKHRRATKRRVLGK